MCYDTLVCGADVPGPRPGRGAGRGRLLEGGLVSVSQALAQLPALLLSLLVGALLLGRNGAEQEGGWRV